MAPDLNKCDLRFLRVKLAQPALVFCLRLSRVLARCSAPAPSRLGAALACLVLIGAAYLSNVQQQYLWLDTGVLPGHSHRGWFVLHNNNPAANMRLAGNTIGAYEHRPITE